VSIPLSGQLGDIECHPVNWPVGKWFGSKFFYRIILLALLVQRIRGLKPDVIQAWNFDMLLAALLAAMTLPGARVVFSLQDTDEWMLSRPLRVIQRWVYKHVDLFFVTSQAFESHLLRRFNLIPEQAKVVFVPNVPPAHFFANFQPRQGQAGLTVGYIGFFRGRQGIANLVQAAQQARTQGCSVRLLFAGVGKEKDFIAQFVRTNDFIELAGPYRYDEMILDLYGKVDVLYAIYDQSYDKQIHLAYRLCEAINCRLPIIVARGTHMAEVAERHGVGVSVDHGDVAGLAAALKALQQDHDLRSRIAANCEAIRHQFVFEFYENTILDAYKTLWPTPCLLSPVS